MLDEMKENGFGSALIRNNKSKVESIILREHGIFKIIEDGGVIFFDDYKENYNDIAINLFNNDNEIARFRTVNWELIE